MELLEREVARARRYARPLSVILGRCREEGGGCGDFLAQGWMAMARDVDFGAQLEGGRWVMALPETGRAGASVAAERFRRGLEALAKKSPGAGECSLCLGVVTHPYHGATAAAMLHAADDLARHSEFGVIVAEFPKEG